MGDVRLEGVPIEAQSSVRPRAAHSTRDRRRKEAPAARSRIRDVRRERRSCSVTLFGRILFRKLALTAGKPCATCLVQRCEPPWPSSQCCVLAAPAQAGFKVCNRTPHEAKVALGRFDGTGWLSEGWWKVQPKGCAVLLTGPLNSRYYYLYATDDASGGWDGKNGFCVAESDTFQIRRPRRLRRPRLRSQRLLRNRYGPGPRLHPNPLGLIQMRRRRKTKIVATLGPSSSSPEQLKALFEAGVDVFRINMSHTSHELLATLHGRVRALEREEGRPIGILADLQGPKIRRRHAAGRHDQADGRRAHQARACGVVRRSVDHPHSAWRSVRRAQAAPLPFDRRRQDPAAHLVVEAEFGGSGRRSGRRDSRTARASICPTRCCRFRR